MTSDSELEATIQYKVRFKSVRGGGLKRTEWLTLYVRNVTELKTCKYIVHILKITIILFSMKQNIQETLKWPP